MRIRDLKWKALPMWPPEWTASDAGAGEEGVLADVQFRSDLSPRLITIVANHLGEHRKGILILEDATQLEILFHNLRGNIGKELSEIGNLTIDFNFPLKKKAQKQARPYKIDPKQSGGQEAPLKKMA